MSTRLLIVDDQENARALIRTFLTMPGITFQECASGTEAVAHAQKFKPHWITVDVRMPGMNGLETIKAIKQAHPEAHVLIVTSFNEPQYRDLARSAGAAGFILKENLLALRLLLARETKNVPAPISLPAGIVKPSKTISKRILVLDDDKKMRTIVGLLLAGEGYDVSYAANSAEAIALHQKKPFDLIVMELLLTSNDGFETFAELRRVSPSKLIVTAKSSWMPVEIHFKTAKQLGAHETLAKPFEPDKMLSAVKSALDEETAEE
jgi:CheY-like chemotaxis protein